MSKLRNRLRAIATEYAVERGRSLTRFLGDGNDGGVWESSQQTAIKVLERRDSYLRERDVYLRLQDREVIDIQGFSIPFLVDFDDTKQVVEQLPLSKPLPLGKRTRSASVILIALS